MVLISLCGGHGYDNASTMSGIHDGVQAQIKEINAEALLNGCASHYKPLWNPFILGDTCVSHFLEPWHRCMHFFRVN